MTDIYQPEYCTTGHDLRKKLDHHTEAIVGLQEKMKQTHQTTLDFSRRVPRAMHESLQSEMNGRSMSRFQLDRHLEYCWQCSSASERANIAA